MTKKRYQRKRAGFKTGRRKTHHGQRAKSTVLENTLISSLYHSPEPLTIQELAKQVTGKRRPEAELHALVTSLLQDKIIAKAGKSAYRIADTAPLYSGHLQLHHRGFGFMPVEKSCSKAPKPGHDIYISARKRRTAMQGDEVLVRLLSTISSDRPEGAVVTILNRGPDTLAGLYKREGKVGYIYPEDNRFPFVITVPAKEHTEIPNGTVVIARFNRPDKADHFLPGTITEVLGPPENIDVQMRLVIEKHQLPHLFSQECLDEAASLPDEIAVPKGREDLRSLMHITIDGETAKDFDDAITVIEHKGGFRLYVSIADVSHFVKPDSGLDKDAYERGTSVYFPGRVIPMLPEKLSNNLCSLVPDEDRLCVTAILDFNTEGRRTGKSFCRSTIRSHKRFTYTEVQAILNDRNGTAALENGTFITMIERAEELAKLLFAQRIQRGSIGFTLPEPEIFLNEDGSIEAIKRAERNFAHQIIEEFMLAANEAVAETFTKGSRKSIYRIHELPDRAKVMEFAEFAKTLGLELPKAELSPHWFGKVLELCKDTPKEYIVNNLLLRTMQQARYSLENKGHFALAAEDYTHFTSPIRRYPDLLVHRELCKYIDEQRGAKTNRETIVSENCGEFLSGRERAAVNSEREMNDRLKMLYMKRHLGESFPAIISGVTDFAFFVELLDLFISGSVPVESLTDDYYLFDAKHHRLFGEITANTYQIGDLVTVTAHNVDTEKNRILFRPTISE